MSRILITGSAGFIGSHTADALLADGHSVLGVDNLRTGSLENLSQAFESPRFEFEQSDVRDGAKLAGLTKRFQPDAILHLAALVSVVEGERDPGTNHDLNVYATHSVAEVARLAGVRRVVFASSAAIYGNAEGLPIRENSEKEPISLYGGAKLASEYLLKAHGRSFGFEAICLRYFNAFGERQDPASPYSGVVSIFAERYAAGKGITIYGDGGQSRDFVHVSDIAQANRAALTQSDAESGSYNVCTGRSASLLDLVAALEDLCPSSPKPQFAEARSGDIRHSLGDPSAAAKAIGFQASMPLAGGLRRLLKSIQPTQNQRYAASA
jgi:UDP-glucose 4-epimerase